MKCVILAGGKGFRIFEYTKKIPKPMIKVAGKPIICHIINHYVKYGFKDFIIATGYKHAIIKNYFKNKKSSVKINVINTGVETLTGLRLKKLAGELKQTFMLTYGDGLSNINLKKLLNFPILGQIQAGSGILQSGSGAKFSGSTTLIQSHLIVDDSSIKSIKNPVCLLFVQEY